MEVNLNVKAKPVMIPYIERTRTYYSTLGYPPYHWAEFEEVKGQFSTLGIVQRHPSI